MRAQFRGQRAMHSMEAREASIVQIAASEEALAAFRNHIQEIIQGAAFKGSHRSAQFLEYIVDRAIAGGFDSLKERIIGIELFGRPPSYDTSIDAIVRVTASDVRKRLLQHYRCNGAGSEFRISLPLGSYVPEIARVSREIAAGAHAPYLSTSAVAEHRSATSGGGSLKTQTVTAEPVAALASAKIPVADSGASQQRWWILSVAAIALLNLAAWALVLQRFPARRTANVTVAKPWSVFFASVRPTHLIASDPDIEGIEVLEGAPIPLSDYANSRYIFEPNRVSPTVAKICRELLHGDKASTTDMQIAVDIAELARSYSRSIDVVGARNLQFSRLRSDDNFIFLGSPLSNPWTSLFNPQLDFRFVPSAYSASDFTGAESIRDFRPRPGEHALYVPTAIGGATGESFAIVALVGNPDQNGQVLLLAGADREGTQAAGKLVTDPARFSAALGDCGLTASGPLPHFEMLLRVDTMANSPEQTAVVACHLLTETSVR